VSNTALDYALCYGRSGWPVFPCLPNRKEPMTRCGFLDATVDEFALERWFGAHPRANIAIATGPPSKILVLDEDRWRKHCGLDDLLKRHTGGKLPRTRTVQTPRGGRHFYFELPTRLKIKCSHDRVPGG
jgi:hypothetical protein